MWLSPTPAYFLGDITMKNKNLTKKGKTIAKPYVPSKIRTVALRIVSLAGGACLGVGFEELVRWLRHLLVKLF